ncbi:hypothetical protein V1478_008850, partial [Vespula squamosa]
MLPQCLGGVHGRSFCYVTLEILIQIPIRAIFQYDTHGIVLKTGTKDRFRFGYRLWDFTSIMKFKSFPIWLSSMVPLVNGISMIFRRSSHLRAFDDPGFKDLTTTRSLSVFLKTSSYPGNLSTSQ